MPTKKYFDKRQKELVEFCERVHEIGIRHTGLSGSLCEDALLRYLRKDIPEMQFYKGHIKKSDLIGKPYPQLDIIICKNNYVPNKKLKRISDVINIVPIEHVKGVIEVKKWAYPKMVGSINTSFKMLRREIGTSMPCFFVTFRFHDSKKNKARNWDHVRAKFKHVDPYCFFGQYSTEAKNLYPWEEGCWKNFSRDCRYSGQYARLVQNIKKTCTN